MQLPNVGELITEGMGMYRVLARLGGTRLSVMSATGIRTTVDYADSGYRDPDNAWRILAMTVVPTASIMDADPATKALALDQMEQECRRLTLESEAGLANKPGQRNPRARR